MSYSCRRSCERHGWGTWGKAMKCLQLRVSDICMNWALVCPFQEEQAAKLKAEKIRVALEKIKEAQVKKVWPSLSSVLSSTDSVWCINGCLVYPLHFFVNFIHSEAGKRRENRSLQCLIVCASICWNQKKTGCVLQDDADTLHKCWARVCTCVCVSTLRIQNGTPPAGCFYQRVHHWMKS